MIAALKPILIFAANVLLIFTLYLGLTFEPREFAFLKRHRIFGRALLLTLLVVPLLTIAVLKILPGPTTVGLVLICLFAISPGVPLMVNGPQKQLVPASTTAALSLVLTAAAVVMLPLWLFFLEILFPEAPLSVRLGELLGSLGIKIFAPFLVGWTIRSAFPEVASRAAPYVELLFKTALVLILIALVLVSLRAWPKVSPWGYIAMFVIIGLSALLGDLFGRPSLEDRALLASTAINGNPLIVMAVVHSSYPDLKVGPALAVYIFLRAAATVPYKLWLKKAMHGNEVPIGASAL